MFPTKFGLHRQTPFRRRCIAYKQKIEFKVENIKEFSRSVVIPDETTQFDRHMVSCIVAKYTYNHEMYVLISAGSMTK